MEYNNSDIRRQDHLLSQEKALHLLREGEYGIMSMVTPEGNPYGIPVNYVWDGNDAIYVHCAPDGRKLRSIRKVSTVSFCIVGNTQVIPNSFTTNYESIVLSCNAEVGLNADERMAALHLLVKK